MFLRRKFEQEEDFGKKSGTVLSDSPALLAKNVLQALVHAIREARIFLRETVAVIISSSCSLSPPGDNLSRERQDAHYTETHPPQPSIPSPSSPSCSRSPQCRTSSASPRGGPPAWRARGRTGVRRASSRAQRSARRCR